MEWHTLYIVFTWITSASLHMRGQEEQIEVTPRQNVHSLMWQYWLLWYWVTELVCQQGFTQSDSLTQWIADFHRFLISVKPNLRFRCKDTVQRLSVQEIEFQGCDKCHMSTTDLVVDSVTIVCCQFYCASPTTKSESDILVFLIPSFLKRCGHLGSFP